MSGWTGANAPVANEDWEATGLSRTEFRVPEAYLQFLEAAACISQPGR